MVMPLLRKLTVLAGAAEAARRYARKHPDRVNRLAERAGEVIDRRTKGRYHKKIKNAVRKVHESNASPR
jgi:hypothetical protein